MAILTTIKQRVGVAALALSAAGAVAVVHHEGVRRTAYVDPVGVVTVCVGHTRTAELGQTLTDAQCAELLRLDIREAEAAVKRLVRVPLTQNQFDSLVSFTFNVGAGNLAKSTLLRKLNAYDCRGAGAEFSRWIYAGGRVLPGLVVRRASERATFETGCATGRNHI